MNFHKRIDNKLIVVLGIFFQKLQKLLWLYAYKQKECDDIQPMAKFKLIGVMGCVTMA
jgi:hypothetical protein